MTRVRNMLKNNAELLTQSHQSENMGVKRVQGIAWLKLALWKLAVQLCSQFHRLPYTKGKAPKVITISPLFDFTSMHTLTQSTDFLPKATPPSTSSFFKLLLYITATSFRPTPRLFISPCRSICQAEQPKYLLFSWIWAPSGATFKLFSQHAAQRNLLMWQILCAYCFSHNILSAFPSLPCMLLPHGTGTTQHTAKTRICTSWLCSCCAQGPPALPLAPLTAQWHFHSCFPFWAHKTQSIRLCTDQCGSQQLKG